MPSSGATTGPGSKFRGRYTITNLSGTSAFTTNFVVTYYYCTSTTVASCSATPIGSQTITEDFNSGHTYTYTSIELTLPANATNGLRYIRAFADSGRAVTERNEGNNDDFDAIFISSSQPDLSVTASSVSGSTAGHNSAFTTRYTLRNGTAQAFTTNFVVRFYYCPAANTTGCVVIGAQSIANNFAGNQSQTFTSPTLRIPSSAQPGSRRLRIQVDATSVVNETNESNNDRYQVITVSTKPDLYFTGSTVPSSGNTNGPGSTFVGRYTITNRTNSTKITTDFAIQYFYCPAANATGCVSLGSQPIAQDLNSGQSYTFNSIQLKLPASVTNGTRYIRAFVDSGAKVSETSESNNNDYDAITVSRALPDLAALSISANPVKQKVGDKFTAGYSITNSGSVDATSVVVRIYFSADTTITTSDRLLLSFTLASIKAGATASGNRTITLPTTLPAGKGFVGMFVDPANAITELSEANNTTSTAFEVLVDKDGDGATNDVDCDDNDKTVNPTAKELCDGKDNNCDTKIDEGCICKTNDTRACFTGSAGCTKQPDGSYKCNAPCKAGSQTCDAAGNWGPCTGSVLPKAETCDGTDEDCNGQIDDKLSRSCYTGPTGTSGVGACKDGNPNL